MKLRAEIEVPEGACWQTIEDAKIKAVWHTVITAKDRMKNTKLDNKCGSCKHFIPKPYFNSECYGDCRKGRKGYRQRSCKACKAYERNNND